MFINKRPEELLGKLKYIAGYIMNMTTISADVTSQMLKWADSKVKKGMYKSRSEMIRRLFREKMEQEEAFMMSHESLKKAWENEDNKYWESFLTKEEKARLQCNKEI